MLCHKLHVISLHKRYCTSYVSCLCPLLDLQAPYCISICTTKVYDNTTCLGEAILPLSLTYFLRIYEICWNGQCVFRAHNKTDFTFPRTRACSWVVILALTYSILAKTICLFTALFIHVSS